MIFAKEGAKKYDQLSKEIDFYETCRSLLRKAKDIYRSYFAEVSFKGKNIDKQEELASRIKELESYVEKTNSANISNYMYLLKMEYAFVSKKYDYGLKVGKEFVETLKTNPVIYSNIRIGYVYFNLADNEISAMRFKSAVKFGLLAKETLINYKSINYILSLDFLATAYFFDGKFKEALNELGELESLSILQKYPFHKSKIFYLKAMIYFASENYKDASLLLNNMPEIEKDKEGWNLWVRIMRLLTSIELLKLKLIDYDVESFRKYIERTDKKYNVGNREKVILKILIELDRCDYDFKETSKNCQELLDKLQLIDSEYTWIPKSPELVIFHDWFLSKARGVSYQPNFKAYLSDIKHEQELKDKPSSSKQMSQLSIEF